MGELEEIKAGSRRTWASGRFDEVAELIWEVGDRLIERLGVGAGETVLDVGAGTGNAAIPAAAAGADVTASDLTPELFEDGRRRAAEAGVELEWVEADAEDLPFDDGAFDCVVSTFGHMFAPRHRVAAEEIARVTAPGGRFGLCCWEPDGNIGNFFKTMGAYLPPPPDLVQPPPMWGNAEHAAAMFEGTGVELEFEHEICRFRYPSPEEGVALYENTFGPMVMAKAALEPQGKWEALREDLVAEFGRGSEPEGDGVVYPGEYLVILGRKPG